RRARARPRGAEGGAVVMIVRVMGEGQFEVADDLREELNEIDSRAAAAVESGDESAVQERLAEAARIATEKGEGLPHPPLAPPAAPRRTRPGGRRVAGGGAVVAPGGGPARAPAGGLSLSGGSACSRAPSRAPPPPRRSTGSAGVRPGTRGTRAAPSPR